MSETTTEPTTKPTYFEALKAHVLEFETGLLRDAHDLAVKALEAEYALITDADALIWRIRGKI